MKVLSFFWISDLCRLTVTFVQTCVCLGHLVSPPSPNFPVKAVLPQKTPRLSPPLSDRYWIGRRCLTLIFQKIMMRSIHV